MIKTDLSEKLFLVEDVSQVNVLTYAEAFKQHDIEQFLTVIRDSEKTIEKIFKNYKDSQSGAVLENGIVNSSKGFQAAWHKIKSEGYTKICAPTEWGGVNYPESVGVAVWDLLYSANPSLTYYLALSIEAAKIINQFGNSTQKKQYCEKLYNCDWAGTFAYSEQNIIGDEGSVQTTATQKDGYFLISGQKEFVVTAGDDLVENNIHLVLAKIENTKNIQKLGIFIVPRLFCENDQSIDNNVVIKKISPTSGMKGLACCQLSFGEKGECRGELLEGLGHQESDIRKTLDGLRLQIANLSTSQLGIVYESACDYIEGNEGEQQALQELSSVQDSQYFKYDTLMNLKSYSQGIRGAVYMTSFFHDCANHGGEGQKIYFADLERLYSRVLKIYATEVGLESIRKGVDIFGEAGYLDNSPLKQPMNDLFSIAMYGGLNGVIAAETLEDIVMEDKGRVFQQLIKQFEILETHRANSEFMNVAIGVWKDYVGGLIVLFSDLLEGDGESENVKVKRFSGKIFRLFGDIIICYHLIRQGMEAEKMLLEMNVNFYNLQQLVDQDPDIKVWYDKLVLSEYFAVNILSQQESIIRIIQD